MPRAPLDRSAALTHARLAQGACVIVLAAGAAVALMGIPGLTPRPAPEALTVPDAPAIVRPATHDDGLVPVQGSGVGSRMSLLANAPKVAGPAETLPGTPPPPPPPPPAEARYIGALALGPKLLAILTDGDKQRVAGVGTVLADGSKVVEVKPEAVTVEKSGVRRDIPLAERQGEAITRLSSSRGSGNAARSPGGTSPRALKAVQAKGGRVPGTPDGSPDRLQEIIRDLRASGQYKDENSLNEAAKEIFQVEAAKFESAGGPS